MMFRVTFTSMVNSLESTFIETVMKKEMFPCPHCGEMIPAKSKACFYCGSDDQTGWSDRTYLDGIDLAGDFDYEEFKEQEFSDGKYPENWWTSRRVVMGIVMAVLFFIAALGYLM
jgi:predicted RNA-binding Zn-ribbon protein involved in translation (DUF1610 family)